MSKRFVYFFFMVDDTERVAPQIDPHVTYWRDSGVEELLAGPFSDRSGGMLSFLARDLEAASAVCMKDPFITADVVTQHWVKEWEVD